jgi:archaeal flagellar protein FlaJ
MIQNQDIFIEIESLIVKEEKLLGEIKKFKEYTLDIKKSKAERDIAISQIKFMKNKLLNLNEELKEKLDRVNLAKKLVEGTKKIKDKVEMKKKEKSDEKKIVEIPIYSPTKLEKKSLVRLTKKEKKITEKKQKGKSGYSQIADKFFSKFSKNLLGNESFTRIERDLIKASLDFTPPGYLSLVLFTTFISGIVGGFIFLFFLFFNVGSTIPLIERAVDPINVRFLKVFWILFVVPIGTFFLMYVYPSMETRSQELKINTELPFAAIHMAAISGSMINPVKIFEIIISTNEYPALQKEFTKLLNEINLYGSDLVSSLKNTAKNSPSKKLSELLNGLATTINSGGDLPNFFEERGQTLLFDHKLAREKESKSAETFMDIYISVVIAAPMILMLLLMMMKMSGLGISMSVYGITTMMVLGVTIVNIVFLTFLQLKRTTE